MSNQAISQETTRCRRPGCGKPFPSHVHYNGIRKAYCSRACLRTHYTDVAREARHAARAAAEAGL